SHKFLLFSSGAERFRGDDQQRQKTAQGQWLEYVGSARSLQDVSSEQRRATGRPPRPGVPQECPGLQGRRLPPALRPDPPSGERIPTGPVRSRQPGLQPGDAPLLQALFGAEAVPLRIWPWLVLGGFLFFLMVEAEKLIPRLGRPR